jgi:exodeoxyribonuclease VII large subunit
VITGVGHETDFTIADFVSDLRAPTPTAAAELATPNRLDLIADVLEQTNQLQRAFFTALADQRSAVSEYMKVLEQRSPVSRVATNRQRLDETTRRAEIALIHALQVSKAHLRGLEQNLASLNPQAVLRRGYAIIKGHDEVLVSMAKQVKRADRLTIRLQDGEIPAVVDGDPIIDL